MRLRGVRPPGWGRTGGWVLLAAGVALSAAAGAHTLGAGARPAPVHIRPASAAVAPSPVRAAVSMALLPSGQPAGAPPPSRIRMARIGLVAPVVTLPPAPGLG